MEFRKVPGNVISSFLLGLVLFFTSAISSGNENKIISEGVADLRSVSLAAARDIAIEDALRRAVEQTVGTLITSESMVQNFTLIFDNIFSKATGYIKTYDILYEGEKNNLYVVRVRADVRAADIKDDLEAIGLLMQRKHKPRVMVIAGEAIDEKDIQILEGLSVTENAIISRFLNKGFKVVDSNTVKKVTERNQLLHTLEGDNMLAAKIGLQYDAEVVIIAKATARSLGYVIEGSRLQSVHANVTGRAIRVDNAEIIASGDKSCNKVHISVIEGSSRAFKTAGEKLATSLIEQILAKWSDEITNLGSVELIFSGLDSFNDLITLSEALRQIRGVKDIHQRSFIGGVAKLEIDLRGNTQTFAKILITKKIGNLRLDITDMTQNSIQARIIKE